jgi:Chaperone of endosialidase
MGILSSIASGIKHGYDVVTGAFEGGHKNDALRQGLQQNALGSRGFADNAQVGYEQGTRDLHANIQNLRDQAEGRNSVSAEQLRQGLQANVAAQRSAAAGADPRNAAMSARTAAIQGARLSSANSGQAAVAGLAERNQAQQALQQALLGQRGQDLQGTLGGYGASNQAYAGQIDPNGDKSWLEKNGGAIAGGMAALSDRRLKEDVKGGDAKARALLDGLKSYTFKYKAGPDAVGGKGEHLGIMAQDLEKVAPNAVMDTPGGKVVHGAKLATALAAASSNLHQRLKKLEGSDE